MFSTVTLEVSLKPFKKTDDDSIRAVAEKIFTDWRPLIKDAKNISIMMWTSDGSEILDYNGNPDSTFEWCYFLGTANLPPLEPGEPIETNLHKKRQKYMENPPVMTYKILKSIVSILKEVGARLYPNATIRIGEIFDIGPEFAISDFKYNRHVEISTGEKIGRHGCVDSTALLKADSYPYAAYPNGIPEGEPFGRFLGKQSDAFLRDMGFDYLWLSNGLGFSANPWKRTGYIYDGEKYYPEKLCEMRERVFMFWKYFREGCPSFPLETRGTNNSVGIDYATDGVPLYDIYNAELNITAPPNSPWAAINDNYGLEIMGHMTRCAELPSEKFPFRYYLHDPWWINSPWYDRYNGTPSDVYMPMSISRIDAQGKVHTANTLNILSIDTSFGEMPEACTNEVIPHLLKAKKDAPTEPAPFVWVYPMREFTKATDEASLREMNEGDNFIMDAINDGFPLCTVISSDNFMKLDPTLLRGAILISPLQPTKEVEEKLHAYATAGGGVIFYGTESALARISPRENEVCVSTEADAAKMREAVGNFGYILRFEGRPAGTKASTMTVSRADNAYHFSAYNANTTSDYLIRFPIGAPILDCGEVAIEDGVARYRFSKSEHRECRVFVDQKSGVVSCRERAPVNRRFRRQLQLRGLEDATVYLFPEDTTEARACVKKSNDDTPIADERFTLIHDKSLGTYLYGEHITGDLYFVMGYRGTQK